jgi:HAD superfamily hydrolase (TIGR01509 family)
MIILIPLGGIGERFKNDGYELPKALINVANKEILFHLIDNLTINDNINFVYIPYNREYIKYDLEYLLSNRYPSIKFKFLVLENNTRGAADTIRIALNNMNEEIKDCPLLCLDSDNFYTTNIIQQWNGENKVFTFIDTLSEPLYSYITVIPDTDIIENIIEKQKISDNACCGAYGFQSWLQLLYYCNYIIDNNITQKNEFYLSGVIKEMLNRDIKFNYKNIQNKYYYSLGTPKQVKEYEYSFLFDLDGTLVNTDHIYTEVWSIIFNKYNFGFVVDKTFFDNFIKGKTDSLFLNYLLPEISIETVSAISILKDELFIEILKNTKDEPILLPGVLEFFELNKNRKIAIVTSCNKKSAEYILEHTGLNNYISLLITANDCIKHKPDPEPYLKAIEKLSLDKAKTIIFEDSYSGYTSAKNAQVYKIILICNVSSCIDIINANEYKISDYTTFTVGELLNINNNKLTENNICYRIKKEILKFRPIKDINRNDIQLKTGYICDIQSYKIILNDKSNENIVLKINNTENELAKTAEKMNLYGNEINFYMNIRHSISSDIIHVPKCYGVVEIDKDQDKDKVRKGIILENLFKYDGKFNIDLNKDVQTLLNVVFEISKLHTTYYFKAASEVPLNMQNVTTMNDLIFFKQLLSERFETFIDKNKLVLKEREIEMMHNCFLNYEKNVVQTSMFPLSFCHGDLKSANIFYRNIDNNKKNIPYLLDWQYIQLNKGVSDIVFLLVESIEFDKIKVDLVLNYYYCLINEKLNNYTFTEFMNDFKTNLCIFPFVVCVWFNSEDNDKLLDKIFPIKFMKNLMKYYNYYFISSTEE